MEQRTAVRRTLAWVARIGHATSLADRRRARRLPPAGTADASSNCSSSSWRRELHVTPKPGRFDLHSDGQGYDKSELIWRPTRTGPGKMPEVAELTTLKK